MSALSAESARPLSDLEKQLLDNFQHEFPLTSAPFLDIARQTGSDEQTVLETFERLQQEGYISRIGPVFRANSIGVSTLCAMAVAQDDIDDVAQLINVYQQVNHNYQRTHHYNLWFVVTAASQFELERLLEDIQQRSGYAILNLPMERDYHIDLGFKLQWI
jgi:DNA-binding Lrp family transcriptional regulator